MRWLVTGANGFIGQHVARALAQQGHDVFALVRQPLRPQQSAKITSVVTSLESMSAECMPADIDAVIHAAALSPASGASGDEMLRVNVEGSAALARWSVDAAVPYFFHLSAMSIYGDASGVVDESTHPRNPDMYGISKRQAEDIITRIRGEAHATSMRLPGVLGRGARTIWLSRQVEALKKNAPVIYYHGASPFNNAVHWRDVLAFILALAATAPAPAPVLALAAGTSMPVKALLDFMKSRLESNSELIEKQSDRQSFSIDCTKARSLGYQPMSLETMLACYIDEEAD